MWSSLKSLVTSSHKPADQHQSEPVQDAPPAARSWFQSAVSSVTTVIQQAVETIDLAKRPREATILQPGDEHRSPQVILGIVARRVDEIDATVQQLLQSAAAYRLLPLSEQLDLDNLAIQAENYDQWVEINSLLTDAYYVLQTKCRIGDEENDLLVSQLQTRVQSLCDEALDTMERHHKWIQEHQAAVNAQAREAVYVDPTTGVIAFAAPTVNVDDAANGDGTHHIPVVDESVAAANEWRHRNIAFEEPIQRDRPGGFEGKAEEVERLEVERLEAERLEAERLEAERLEAERREAERLEAERLEAERLEAERLEAERLEAEREAARREAERLEAERLEAERLEAERLEAERLEAERLEAERLEAERLEADREAARREAERLEPERSTAEQQSTDTTRGKIKKLQVEPKKHTDARPQTEKDSGVATGPSVASKGPSAVAAADEDWGEVDLAPYRPIEASAAQSAAQTAAVRAKAVDSDNEEWDDWS